jgi:carboxypeptidase D
VYDPCIGSFVLVGQEIPTYPFVAAHQEILGLDQETMDKLEKMHNHCGYADFIDKYLQFPPPGNQPEEPVYNYGKCDVFNTYADAM